MTRVPAGPVSSTSAFGLWSDQSEGQPGAVELAAARAAWAALAPVVAGGCPGRVRVSADGGRSYPGRRERALSAVLPAAQPAAVLVYDQHAGTAGCLVADFDTGRGGQGQVDADVARLLELLAAVGARAFSDRSPSGGRHVYVPWAVPVAFERLRPVVLALSALLPSLDPQPMLSVRSGCIRPPGSRHKSGGWQVLDGPLPAALAVASSPNGPDVWAALSGRLRPQLAVLEHERAGDADAVDRGLDGVVDMLSLPAGSVVGSWELRALQVGVARAGGARAVGPVAELTARTGAYDQDRYASPSQARQGVLVAAACAGWSIRDVHAELEAGRWPGLWGFYARYAPKDRRSSLARDWVAAVAYARQEPAPRPLPGHPRAIARPAEQPGQSHARRSDTSEQATHAGGSSPASLKSDRVRVSDRVASHGLAGGDVLNGHQQVRSWWSALLVGERVRYAGRDGQSRRLVLRALGNAAMMVGRVYVEFGVRHLSLAAGLSPSTTAQVLRELAAEPDPYVVLVSGGRGLRADLYELRVPGAFSEAAASRPWRPGRLDDALLPVFRKLSKPAAFLYEVLHADQSESTFDLAAAALVSERAAQEALLLLAEHGLAERLRSGADDGAGRGGWRRGPASPAAVARTLGVEQVVAGLVERFRAARARWRTWLAEHGVLLTAAYVLAGSQPHRATPSDPSCDHDRWPPAQPQPPPAVTRAAHGAGLDVDEPSIEAQVLALLERELDAVLID